MIAKRPTTSRPALLAAILSTTAFACPHAAAAASVEKLIGSWGGSGTYTLQDGTSEKLRCDAYYNGNASQLSMVIRCAGPTNKIEIRGKLNVSGSALSGSWEERTYNAEGAISGSASGNRLAFAIQGGVTGKMSVSYSATSQSVSIATQGIPLKSVSVSLRRR